MAEVTRRQFFTRAVPGAVAAVLGPGGAAPGAAAAGPPAAAIAVSARDLRPTSRAEVRRALRRIAARRRGR
jgi:hypothetical protein